MRVNGSGLLVAETEEDPNVFLFPSERSTRLDGQPQGVVWHWTAGDYGADVGHGDSEALCRSIVKRPPAGSVGASWHVLIDRDGSVFQCVPVITGAWHVGAPGEVAGKTFRNVNRATIGIELENAGRLKESGGRFYAWPYWRRAPDGRCDPRLGPDPRYGIPRERAHRIPLGCGPVEAGLFDAYDVRQVAAAGAVLGALVQRFGWKRDVCGYGHYMFSYKTVGKEDPGPGWQNIHLPSILAGVFGPLSVPAGT